MRWKEDDNWLIWFDLLTELFWMHTGHWEEHSAVLSDHHTYDSAQVWRSTLHWQELTHNGKRKAWQLESSFDLICWQSFWMHRTLSSTLSSSLSSAQWSHLSLITQHRYESQHEGQHLSLSTQHRYEMKVNIENCSGRNSSTNGTMGKGMPIRKLMSKNY